MKPEKEEVVWICPKDFMYGKLKKGEEVSPTLIFEYAEELEHQLQQAREDLQKQTEQVQENYIRKSFSEQTSLWQRDFF